MKAAVFLVAVFFLRSGIGLLMASAPPLPGPARGLLHPLATFACVLLLTAAFARLDGTSADRLGLVPRPRYLAHLAAGALLSTVAFAGLTLLAGRIVGVRWVRNPEGEWQGVVGAAALLALAAMGDELANRGYGFRRLFDALGVWPAQLTLAALMAIFHWSPEVPPHALPFVLGIPALSSILFGLAYLKTGQLGLAVGLHLGGNWATLGLLDGRADPGMYGLPPGLWRPAAGGLSAVESDLFGVLLPSAAAMALLLVALARWKGTAGRLL